MCAMPYRNFVKPTSSSLLILKSNQISGEEAKRIYIEEIKDCPKTPKQVDNLSLSEDKINTVTSGDIELSDKDLFVTVQCNDAETLKRFLHIKPDKINTIDEYGWSLLMIACQANAVEIVKLLLENGVNTDIRDKAGNSARSLIIKNKNYTLADILSNHRKKNENINEKCEKNEKLENPYHCDMCDKTYRDKEEHLSSTIHNISASKGKKIPPCYIIPSSNKGYQIMVKVGWDKESGLGPDGAGNKYPIKVKQKNDKKGLGVKKKLEEPENVALKKKLRNNIHRNHHKNRQFEINFRRQFY